MSTFAKPCSQFAFEARHEALPAESSFQGVEHVFHVHVHGKPGRRYDQLHEGLVASVTVRFHGVLRGMQTKCDVDGADDEVILTDKPATVSIEALRGVRLPALDLETKFVVGFLDVFDPVAAMLPGGGAQETDALHKVHEPLEGLAIGVIRGGGNGVEISSDVGVGEVLLEELHELLSPMFQIFRHATPPLGSWSTRRRASDMSEWVHARPGAVVTVSRPLA